MLEIIDNKVLRCHERDIIRVKINEDYIQPFYRSTGRNSNLEGEWLPFDGLYVINEQVAWFDKNRFVCNLGGKYHNINHSCLHRYGTKELKFVSRELSKMSIPPGIPATGTQVNKFLNYQNPFEILM